MADEIRWLTADGRSLRYQEITDDHLKNIVRHVFTYVNHYPNYVHDLVITWATMRGFDVTELIGPPMPWLDESDGKWKTYDPDKQGYIEVPAPQFP